VRALMMGLAMSVAVQVWAADALTEALQKGLFEEEANQNLEAAIKAYQDVLSRADEQRRVAATALFRLAECYRKQGKTNEATAEYHRLVRDYSEQSTLVNLSRQNLVGLGANTTVVSATAPKDGDPLTTDEEQQEIQRIRGLIKNSPDLINARNRTLWGSTKGTVLHEAAYKGHLLVADYLLANGADIHALDSSKATPLYHAAGNGHKKMVELLLAKGAQPSPADSGQPLQAAVERGFKGVVEVLLAHKADVNGGFGMTALHVAIKEKNLSIAELLLANGANPNAVYVHSWNQGQGVLHSLGTLDGTPLHFAVQIGNPTFARMLIAKGADVNARTTHAGLVPIHYAANPNLQPDAAKALTEMLLEAGAKIDTTGSEVSQLPGWTPLHLAVYHKVSQGVALLLEKGADPNFPFPAPFAYEGTALNVAISRGGESELVELLLKNKAAVNARDFSGNTPLLRAVRESNQQIAELLLAHKADVASVNSDGNTALALAVQAGNLSIAEVLLSKGANANDTNAYGFPMLHVALGAQPPSRPGFPVPLGSVALPPAFGGGPQPQPIRIGGYTRGTSSAEKKPDKTMLQLLLEHKADPNQFDKVRDKESETALHVAARNGDQAAVELLLKNKADPNARTDSGITPLYRAVEVKAEGLVDLLLAHNADVKAAKSDGDTALHLAAARGATNVVAKLVQRGADINACGDNGETPLHKTIRWLSSNQPHQRATVEFLLNAGADMLKRCNNRLSAFEQTVLQEKMLPGDRGLTDFFRKHYPKKLAAAIFDGEVVRPVWFWEADKPPTLSEAIEAVGLKDTADPTRVTLMRNDPDRGSAGYRHNLVAIREKRTADVPLKHGDKITVAVRAD